MTALDNILAGRTLAMRRGLFWQLIRFGPALAEEVAHRRRAEEIIDFLKIQAIRKIPVGRLPYGLQKRVELARALAMEPDLLLLDEPMAGMNLEEKEDMSRFILDVNEQYGITIALIEHDMGVVMDISDRVVVLDHGIKIADGTPEQVKSDQAVIDAYLGVRDEAAMARESARASPQCRCEGRRTRSGFGTGWAGCPDRRRRLMDILYKILISPFVQMGAAPDLLVQTLWEGLVAGVLYALIALGFVLIFKASAVFNFAQGIMVVFAALTLVGLDDLLRRWGVGSAHIAAFAALGLTIVVMLALAVTVERLVLRPLINQSDIILFMATFGLTYFLIGFGEFVFGGEPKVMIAEDLYLPRGAFDIKMLGGFVSLQKIDIAAALIASILVTALGIFFQRTRIGRALRAVADSHKAALSVGISLEQIWVIVWFAAGIVAIATGIMWGARSQVAFDLQIIALKALPVLILGGLTSIPGAIVGGLIIGIGEKLGEFYWGPLLGNGIESWLAYVIALGFLLFRPEGLFGERIIERV